MKEIPLSRGLVALVDDEDFEFLSRWTWHVTAGPGSRTWYAARITKRSETGKQTSVSMHRVIMGAERGQMIDHADHNGLNNTRANLRFCSWAQNSSNSPIPVSVHGYRGISPSTDRWRARIRVNGKQVPLGTYDTREDAARAYDAAAFHYYGEFATLNFPAQQAIAA